MAQWYEAVHTSKRFRLGTRKTAINGNEYIYLKGVASVVAGDAVLYDELFVTTRSLAATIGRFAIAQAAVDATTKFGWFLIYGTCSANVLASFADNTMIFTTSTAGSVDDSGAGAEEFVNGAFGRSAVASGQATLELNYPYKHAANLD
jgi:hypothetical protein